MAPFLNVHNLSFRYPDYYGLKNRDLFINLSFSVERGEIAVFLAPPESGKTTLSRIITSLVPRYTGGKLTGNVSINNMDALAEKPYNLIETAGIVFQNPDEQILTQEVETEIGFALEASGYDYDVIKKKTDAAVESAGISYLRGMNPAFLSGGEKRKLLFGCLSAMDPQLWVLDETFEEIDPSSRISLLDYIKSKKITVLILTSKMLDIYKKYADSFFLFNRNRLISSGSGRMPDADFIAEALECGVFLDSRKLAGKIHHSAENSAENTAENTGGRVVLKAEKLAFSYPGKSSGFSLEVEDFYLARGEAAVLIGKNGSGKSTLARIISGLLKPDSGSIKLGKDNALKEADADVLNRNTAYLFQNPDLQLFLPTVGEELMFGLKSIKEDKEACRRRIDDAVELFRLESLDTPPAIMSYGARKRLQAAIYYLLEKKIVIIDEADSGLSFNDYILILKNLKNLKPAPAVLIITHDIKLSAGIADRIIIMENGQIKPVDTDKKFQELLDISMAGGSDDFRNLC